MRARLRDVPVGTRFETTLTGRRGRVLDFWPDEPRAAFVVFTDDDEGKWLHPEVVVEADEVAH